MDKVEYQENYIGKRFKFKDSYVSGSIAGATFYISDIKKGYYGKDYECKYEGTESGEESFIYSPYILREHIDKDHVEEIGVGGSCATSVESEKTCNCCKHWSLLNGFCTEHGERSGTCFEDA